MQESFYLTILALLIIVLAFFYLYKMMDKNKTVKPIIENFNSELYVKGTSKISQFQTDIELISTSRKSYVVSIIKDGFTDEKIIKFRQISAYIYDKILTYGDGDDFITMHFGLRNVNGKNFMYFETHQKTIKFKKNDSIMFLFENEEKIEFKLLENGYRNDRDNEGIIIESFSEISDEFIVKFKELNCLKWRYISNTNGKKATGTIPKDNQNLTREMAAVFTYVLENNIGN
jgi:hypothetical protein